MKNNKLFCYVCKKHFDLSEKDFVNFGHNNEKVAKLPKSQKWTTHK